MISPESVYRAYRSAPINPNAYRDWNEYRRTVTDFIEVNTEAGSTVTVYGAGRCDDIDISRLRNHFSSILLADIDETAMEKVDCCEKINKQLIDFTGMEDEVRIDFTRLAYYLLLSLADGGTEEELDDARDKILLKIEDIYENLFLTEPENTIDKTDCAIVLGVHSQLNNFFSGMWVHLIKTIFEAEAVSEDKGLAKWISRVFEDIVELQKKYTEETVRRFNSMVIGNTSKTLIFGYELSSYSRPDSFIEGAIQGAGNIVRLAEEGRLRMKKHTEADWPLIPEQNVIYKMMIGAFELPY